MIVVTLDREPRVDPVLLALSIIPHVRIAKRRQFTGGVFRSMSRRVGAVDDDFSRLVGQQGGR